MNIEEYKKLKGFQTWEVFDEAYRWKYGNVCRDGKWLILQKERYEKHGVVPWFVGDYMRFVGREVATIPDDRQLSFSFGDDQC
jgi:hypothetical protein